MSHKYIDKFFKNGYWHYVYDDSPLKSIGAGNKGLFSKKNVNNYANDLFKQYGKTGAKSGIHSTPAQRKAGKRFNIVRNGDVNDMLKSKNKALIQKYNERELKGLGKAGKKIASFLTSIGVSLNNKAIRKEKAESSIYTAQKRGRKQTEYYNKLAAKNKANKSTEIAQKRGQSQTEYYKKLAAKKARRNKAALTSRMEGNIQQNNISKQRKKYADKVRKHKFNRDLAVAVKGKGYRSL